MEKQRKQHNFLHGALILVISTAVVKVIGAIFKIPLGNLIGEVGMGYFSVAYDIYTPVYTIAMAGLPIAISKLVAEAVAKERFKDARSYFRVAKKAFFITGFIGFMLIALVAYPYTLWISKSFGALYSILVVAPSMLFCCVMACYRGYYEGLRNMNPTAVSQILEAAGKLVFGFGIAFLIVWAGIQDFQQTGTVFGEVITDVTPMSTPHPFFGSIPQAVFNATLPYAAAGAIGGVTLGTLIGAIFLILRHKICGDGITQMELEAAPAPQPDRKNLKVLLVFALPVVLGTLAQTAAGFVDVVMVQWELGQSVSIGEEAVRASHGTALASTAASEVPAYLYGCYRGFAYSFYNLIPTITSMIGISVLPNLATAWAKNDEKMVKFNIEAVIRVVSIIAIPAGLGISVLSEPILSIFYPNNPGGVLVSSKLLRWLAVSGILAGISMPITSMLQAIGKQKVPIKNILIGMGVKIVMNLCLIMVPQINIMGAAYSTVACYAVIVVLNIISLARHSKVMPNLWSTLGKPVISGVLCGVAAWVCYGLLNRVVVHTILAVAVAVVAAAIVYLIALFCLRTISKEDVKLLPKGEKIAKVLEKFRLIG